MSNKKFIPNKTQKAAFDKVIKAIKSAQKAGLVFYGKQWDLVAYTKEADSYAHKVDFETLLRGRHGEIHFISSSVLSDSGADDYGKYLKSEDNPDNNS